MNNSGLSQTRLVRMRDVLAGHVERGEVPGVVTLINRHGATHVEALGLKALGGDPIQRDAIFRIASMTKPITATAALILIEECRLRLDEPVDRLLPELADRRVLTRLDGPLDDTVPANRPISVRDLLTCCMGFGYLLSPDEYPILQAMRGAPGIGMGPPSPARVPVPDKWMGHLGTLPLMHQPGERWMYNTASDVLGVLIARASDQPFETFLRERIFGPLGMQDTGFSVPPDKLNRLATSYAANEESGALELYDGVDDSQWRKPPAFPSGASGLVSTVDDYVAFGQMLLRKGTYNGERILSRPTVELMTTDQLMPEQRAGSAAFLSDNRGWGFGVSIITRRDDVAASPGRYGWDGGLGTSGYSDPREDMVAILMTQVMGFPSGIYEDFWTSVYQAIDD